MKKFFQGVRLQVWAVSGVLVAGLLFGSCKKSVSDTPNTNVSAVMAFNLSPEVSAAGFSLSGNNLLSTPLSFNSYSGTYRLIYPGNRSVETFSFNSGNTLASTSSFTFEPQKYYSVFLLGTTGSFENLVVTDNLDSLSGTGKSFVRYINAIQDASSPVVKIISNGNNVVDENAAYKTVSSFVAIDPGQVMIDVSNGGTIDVDRTITLEQQGIYTVLISGKPGATGDTGVQIKFIQNGKVNESGNRSASSGSRPVN